MTKTNVLTRLIIAEASVMYLFSKEQLSQFCCPSFAGQVASVGDEGLSIIPYVRDSFQSFRSRVKYPLTNSKVRIIVSGMSYRPNCGQDLSVWIEHNKEFFDFIVNLMRSEIGVIEKDFLP